MSLSFNLIRAFAVCATLGSCGSLSKMDAAEVPAHPAKKAAVTLHDIKGFGKPERSPANTATVEPDLPFDMLMDQVRRENCVRLPKDDFTYVSGEWVYDCEPGLRATESGDFLIKQLLEKEYQKRTGVFEVPPSYIDERIFNFSG